MFHGPLSISYPKSPYYIESTRVVHEPSNSSERMMTKRFSHLPTFNIRVKKGPHIATESVVATYRVLDDIFVYILHTTAINTKAYLGVVKAAQELALEYHTPKGQKLSIPVTVVALSEVMKCGKILPGILKSVRFRATNARTGSQALCTYSGGTFYVEGYSEDQDKLFKHFSIEPKNTYAWIL